MTTNANKFSQNKQKVKELAAATPVGAAEADGEQRKQGAKKAGAGGGKKGGHGSTKQLEYPAEILAAGQTGGGVEGFPQGEQLGSGAEGEENAAGDG